MSAELYIQSVVENQWWLNIYWKKNIKNKWYKCEEQWLDSFFQIRDIFDWTYKWRIELSRECSDCEKFDECIENERNYFDEYVLKVLKEENILLLSKYIKEDSLTEFCNKIVDNNTLDPMDKQIHYNIIEWIKHIILWWTLKWFFKNSNSSQQNEKSVKEWIIRFLKKKYLI